MGSAAIKTFVYRYWFPLRKASRLKKIRAALSRPYLLHFHYYFDTDPPRPFSLSLACAAASRAIGTR